MKYGLLAAQEALTDSNWQPLTEPDQEMTVKMYGFILLSYTNINARVSALGLVLAA